MIREVLVFDLVHNRYRLITPVFFATRELYIKALLTHKAYNRKKTGRSGKMVLTLSCAKYGKLLSKVMPKPIETDAEFDHFVSVMEALSRAIARKEASPEEKVLHSLLSTLVREYDDRVHPLPTGDPIRILRYLMEQPGLRPVDLVPIFGARSITSLVLNGKRELSKTHIRKLAELFHVSPALFLEA